MKQAGTLVFGLVQAHQQREGKDYAESRASARTRYPGVYRAMEGQKS